MTGRLQLLEELKRICENCCHLVGLAQDEHLDYRPLDGMRSLRELGNHLAQIPAIDLTILKGAKENEVQDAERSLDHPDPAGWCEVLREGQKELHRYMERLSLDEYENSSGTAFYGRTQTNAQWLLEIVTHLYHHRAQFFMYLKLNGYDVSTRTLYQ